MDYYGNNDWRDYLAHYGVKGMKWRKHKYKNKIGEVYDYATGKLKDGGKSLRDFVNYRITGKGYLKRAARFNERAHSTAYGNRIKDPKQRLVVSNANSFAADKAISDYNKRSLAGKLRKKKVRSVERGISRKIENLKYTAGGELLYGAPAKRKEKLRENVKTAIRLSKSSPEYRKELASNSPRGSVFSNAGKYDKTNKKKRKKRTV